MIKWLIRSLGLPGSWSWACRQMKKGHAVYPKDDTNTNVCYKVFPSTNHRIKWTFDRMYRDNLVFANGVEWKNAGIFLHDMYRTDWTIK